MRIVFDLESDGLLDKVTKIYCVSYFDIDTFTSKTLTSYKDIKELFNTPNLTIIGHNIIKYDIPVLEKILNIVIDCIEIDTLGLSWYLYPERVRHGLEYWGEDLGIKKPEIEDWENLSLEEYVHRCEEDVKINTKMFIDIMIPYLKLVYNDKGSIDDLMAYLTFKLKCAREQEDTRWKLDVDKCNENLETLNKERDSKIDVLQKAMPPELKYRVINKPKKPYKKDGTYSAIGEKWFRLLFERGLDEDHEEPLKILKEKLIGNPGSHDQLKSWLFSIGWEPATFKYNKVKVDGEYTGEIKEVPQLSLPFGQGLCQSVKDLYDIEPSLSALEGLFVINHRISILEGLLETMDSEGYVIAEIAGLTNTLRFKHRKPLTNLPGIDKAYGNFIRGVLIAPEGYILCGSDMSSLEDRTKQHYMYFFDPEYVETMIKPGFDPHLDLAEFAYGITNGEMGVTEEDVSFYKSFTNGDDKNRYKHIKGERQSFKTVNYAAVYGSGATTMSRSSGMSIPKCKTLIKAYWKKNWSVEKVAESCLFKTINGQMWLFNPVSRFWYTLRYKKDKFSTLNQGTGVYCFDMWVKKSREKGIKMCGQFHDETISPVFNAPLDIINREKDLRQSIKEVNEELKLNRELDIDVQFGSTYADIH